MLPFKLKVSMEGQGRGEVDLLGREGSSLPEVRPTEQREAGEGEASVVWKGAGRMKEKSGGVSTTLISARDKHLGQSSRSFVGEMYGRGEWRQREASGGSWQQSSRGGLLCAGPPADAQGAGGPT